MARIRKIEPLPPGHQTKNSIHQRTCQPPPMKTCQEKKNQIRDRNVRNSTMCQQTHHHVPSALLYQHLMRYKLAPGPPPDQLQSSPIGPSHSPLASTPTCSPQLVLGLFPFLISLWYFPLKPLVALYNHSVNHHLYLLSLVALSLCCLSSHCQ